MIHDPDLLDKLQGHGAIDFDGEGFRHVLGAYPPQRENTAGARWNPPGTAAIYTSLLRETALAEAAYRLGLQPEVVAP